MLLLLLALSQLSLILLFFLSFVVFSVHGRTVKGRNYCLHITSILLKDDSNELHLIQAAAADSCVSAEIGNFSIFCNATVCCSYMHQAQL